MNNKIVGLILIAAGVALGLWGYDVYDSVSAEVTRVFNGDTPIEAWAGMIGGVVCILLGIMRIK